MTQVSFSRVTAVPTMLFIGNEESGKDSELLDSLAVSNIITLIGQCEFMHKYKYFSVNIDDSPCEDIYRFFEDTYDFIESAEYSTLVQCAAGISRSATIVLAYIMKKLHVPLTEAVRLLKIDRPMIDPNNGFMMQLRIYQRVLGIPDSNLQSTISRHTPLFKKDNITILGPELLYDSEFAGGRYRDIPVKVYSRFAVPEFDKFQLANITGGGYISLISDTSIPYQQDGNPVIICATDTFVAGILAYNILHRAGGMIFEEIKDYLAREWPAISIQNKYFLNNIERYLTGDIENIKIESLLYINQLKRMLNFTNPQQMYSMLNALNNLNTFNIQEVVQARDDLRAFIVNCIEAIAEPDS